jgi:hypothetical protein
MFCHHFPSCEGGELNLEHLHICIYTATRVTRNQSLNFQLSLFRSVYIQKLYLLVLLQDLLVIRQGATN